MSLARKTIRKIEITFDLPVELTDDEQVALSRVVDQICYRECPDGWAFWPSSFGDKPNLSQCDAKFLGKPVDETQPMHGEQNFDNTVYAIDCCARQLVRGKK